MFNYIVISLSIIVISTILKVYFTNIENFSAVNYGISTGMDSIIVPSESENLFEY